MHGPFIQDCYEVQLPAAAAGTQLMRNSNVLTAALQRNNGLKDIKMLPVDEDELHFRAIFLCCFVTTSFLFHTSDPLQK